MRYKTNKTWADMISLDSNNILGLAVGSKGNSNENIFVVIQQALFQFDLIKLQVDNKE